MSGPTTTTTGTGQPSQSHFIRINQDELKTRPKCLTMTAQVLSRNQTAVIDRCNFDISQRSHFIQLAQQYRNIPVDCVVFDMSLETCLSRCRTRRGHPTLPPSKATSVIRNVAQHWIRPTRTEGIRHIYIIRDNTTLRQVFQQLVGNGSGGGGGTPTHSPQTQQQQSPPSSNNNNGTPQEGTK
jgi:predicted kinase